MRIQSVTEILTTLDTGIHPMNISDAFGIACEKGVEILQKIAVPVELNDRESLLKSASTSLNSKVTLTYDWQC
jgi:T-complex protein 1 subunit delta